jgi:hypothetical protein
MKSGDLDFLKVYGYLKTHSNYATRRVWRVFSVRARIHLPHNHITSTNCPHLPNLSLSST